MKKRGLWLLYWVVVFVLACSPDEREIPAGGGAVVKIPDKPPVVAITFDDGPHPVNTRKLLDALAVREIPATFFLVGERLAGNEALVREMEMAGHQIGSHTWNHVMLDETVQPQEFVRQMTQTEQALEHILGEGEYWLRPPYGILAPRLQRLAETPLIIWSVDPEDWRDRDKARIVDYVLSRVGDGDIILMHDMFDASVEAAVEICDKLLERGFCFATVEELMALRGTEPVDGRRYNRVLP